MKILGTPIVGKDVELQIEINRPNVSFVWLKDDRPLEEQPIATPDQTKYRLKLTNLTEEQSGVYAVRFNDGELEDRVTLKVALAPLEFVEQLKCLPSDDVEEGTDVVLQCVMNRSIDDETIPIVVTKNGKALPTQDIERNGPTINVHLKNVQQDDAGKQNSSLSSLSSLPLSSLRRHVQSHRGEEQRHDEPIESARENLSLIHISEPTRRS